MSESMTLEQIIHFLLEAPMFGDLDPTELGQIVQIMQVQRLKAGQCLFDEGSIGDAWHVIYEGEVTVEKEGSDGPMVIAQLGPRSCFGEMSILDGSARSATVRAATSVTTFRFPRVAFNRLLLEENLAAYKLIHQMALVLVRRQRDTTSRLAGFLSRDPDASSLEPILVANSQSE